jgi:hypothetical protein
MIWKHIHSVLSSEESYKTAWMRIIVCKYTYVFPHDISIQKKLKGLELKMLIAIFLG